MTSQEISIILEKIGGLENRLTAQDIVLKAIETKLTPIDNSYQATKIIGNFISRFIWGLLALIIAVGGVIVALPHIFSLFNSPKP